MAPGQEPTESPRAWQAAFLVCGLPDLVPFFSGEISSLAGNMVLDGCGSPHSQRLPDMRRLTSDSLIATYSVKIRARSGLQVPVLGSGLVGQT